MVLSFSVVYCLTHVLVRFRAPTEPIMAIVVAVLLADVYVAWRAGWTNREDTDSVHAG